MTEREKMLSGLMYYPGDQELAEERERCKINCSKYNRLEYDKYEERNELIKEIVGKAGEDFYIEQPFYCDYGYNIEIGEGFYSNHGLIILDCAKVKIGKNVMIGPNCGIYTACHPLDSEERSTGVEFSKAVTIGDNVWIGGGVHIMPGVKIGNNCVIGGGSVVVSDIPDNTVAVGNPCRVIKNL